MEYCFLLKIFTGTTYYFECIPNRLLTVLYNTQSLASALQYNTGSAPQCVHHICHVGKHWYDDAGHTGLFVSSVHRDPKNYYGGIHLPNQTFPHSILNELIPIFNVIHCDVHKGKELK